MHEVDLHSRPPGDLVAAVAAERVAALVNGPAARLRARLAGRSVVNVNSAAVGGGVAEMLHGLLPYARGAGIDARWFVLDGDDELFRVTKRLHNRLHGQPGDGGPLGAAEARHLAAVAAENADRLAGSVVAGDVLVVHDPQPAALLPLAAGWGVPVVWRCHIGPHAANRHSTEAWEFLRPFLDGHVDAYVFTRASYAPDWVPADRLHVIRPSIDPLSPKNQEMDPATVVDTLRHVGVVSGSAPDVVAFRRADGSPGRVVHYADIVRTGPAPSADAPLVVQVSRWDRLKDMAGVMHAFVDHVLDGTDAHLVLAGPVVTGVADDPEGADVLDDVREQWHALPHAARSRVQLVCLPMSDSEENAAIVNALQRHATVVVQKSIEEGFGLTVAEAMYKRAAVVASRVGGIVDQVVDGVDGRLVEDPYDLAEFGRDVAELLADPAARAALGVRARANVVAEFLPDTALTRWAEVIEAAMDRHADDDVTPARAP